MLDFQEDKFQAKHHLYSTLGPCNAAVSWEEGLGHGDQTGQTIYICCHEAPFSFTGPETGLYADRI